MSERAIRRFVPGFMLFCFVFAFPRWITYQPEIFPFSALAPACPGSSFNALGAAPAVSARQGGLSHRSGTKLTGRGSEPTIAPVMSKLPAQEPFGQ